MSTARENDKSTKVRAPKLWQALIPLFFMIGMLTWSIVLFGVDAALGPLQVALILSAVVAAVVARFIGHTWEMLAEEVVKGISLAMTAILILLMVGALIGVWNMSGTIATVVYYGIKYIDPAWFYFATALLTGIIGIVTGSSWTTAATVGVAFVGISRAIGASEAITAGAVISGAYFGDKMTPLSETTILTPQIVGSNVYAHIRSLAKASIPAFGLALLLFFILGQRQEIVPPPMNTDEVLAVISSVYNISIWNLLPIVVLLVLGLRKFPPFLSILIGTLTGGLVAVIFQQPLLTAFANDEGLSAPLVALKSTWVAMANGFVLESPYAELNQLFTGGGMSSMLLTVWLILGAMSFGAIMDSAGFNKALIDPVIRRVNSDAGTIATTMFTSLGFNIVGGDQYIAIVLPARMFLVTFRERGLHPETLATAVENSGTITSPLIPWNSCGAYMSAALGVSTLVYFPYCFFNFLNFFLALIYAFLHINVQHLSPEEMATVGEVREAPLLGGVHGMTVSPINFTPSVTMAVSGAAEKLD
jgi:NhaC family Na+:H+ antiporter